jgi:hypothetical protein
MFITLALLYFSHVYEMRSTILFTVLVIYHMHNKMYGMIFVSLLFLLYFKWQNKYLHCVNSNEVVSNKNIVRPD